MHQADILEIKAFVPARDFSLSLAFHADLGFELRSPGGGMFERAAPCPSLQDQGAGHERHEHPDSHHLRQQMTGLHLQPQAIS